MLERVLAEALGCRRRWLSWWKKATERSTKVQGLAGASTETIGLGIYSQRAGLARQYTFLLLLLLLLLSNDVRRICKLFTLRLVKSWLLSLIAPPETWRIRIRGRRREKSWKRRGERRGGSWGKQETTSTLERLGLYRSVAFVPSAYAAAAAARACSSHTHTHTEMQRLGAVKSAARRSGEKEKWRKEG